MRTLVGAAEPPRRPVDSFSITAGTNTAASTTCTSIVAWALTNSGAAPRPPIRTTAWVGRPVPELES